MEEIKTFGNDSIEFEERAFKDFGNGFDWLSKLNCQDERDWFFREMLHSTENAKFQLEVLMREIIPVVREKLSLKTEVHKLKSFYQFFPKIKFLRQRSKTTALSVET